MQTTSSTGRSRGAPSRTATAAGSVSSSTSTIVAMPSPSDSSRLVPKPSAAKIWPYASAREAPVRDLHREERERRDQRDEEEQRPRTRTTPCHAGPPWPAAAPGAVPGQTCVVTWGVSEAIGRSFAAAGDRRP